MRYTLNWRAWPEAVQNIWPSAPGYILLVAAGQYFAGTSLGYPDEEARRARPKVAHARRPLSEIVHFERYS